MAKFDESKIITALHPEKAEVGKKYWFADNVVWLKRKVENNESYSTLKNFESPYFEVVTSESLTNKYFLLYPYEESPKQRMTNIQLLEWLAKEKGLYKNKVSGFCGFSFTFGDGAENDVVRDVYCIRTWDSEEWIEPTYEIYLKDCKSVTHDEFDRVAWNGV